MNTYDKENVALDILIAQTLRNDDQVLNEDETNKSDTTIYKLPQKYKKVLKNIEDDTFNKLFNKSDNDEPFEPELNNEYTDACVAMHRDNPLGVMDIKIKDEIDEIRKQIIENEKKKSE